MSLQNHPSKANMVADSLSRLSMRSLAHMDKEKRELVKNTHRLANLEVHLLDSENGGKRLGTKVNFSAVFYPQLDGKMERIIQMLEDMPCSCVSSWVEHLPLIEFAYNNKYHSSIGMAPFEALYGRRYRSLIGWFEVGEAKMFGLDLVHQAMEKVKVIQET
ncbi:hypothetical protein FXO38_33529 [Capsicum annuum]|nr:hypothetical protein FXO38_33529 [Capsicum annuum]